MPLWRIFAHANTFSHAQRAALARDITALYAMLPAFDVNVIFINAGDADVWVGGQPRTDFVRVVVEQIARKLLAEDTAEGAAQRKWWMDRITETMKPHPQARPELEWELHVAETPRDLWRINGIDPPPKDSEAEKIWKEQDKALPYESSMKGLGRADVVLPAAVTERQLDRCGDK